MDGSKLCYIYFILSQAIWGVLPAFWLLLRQLPPLYTLASRIVWASVFCFFLIIQKKLLPDLKGVRQERWQWPYIAGACIFITLNWGSYIYATTQGFILQASLAYFINPIVLVFFGGLLFHERLRPIQKLSVVVAGAGLVLAFCLYGVVPHLPDLGDVQHVEKESPPGQPGFGLHRILFHGAFIPAFHRL